MIIYAKTMYRLTVWKRMHVYAAIRIPPICCSDNEKRYELIRKTENLLTQSGYHCECRQQTRDCIEQAISVLIDASYTYLNCIAIPVGYVELNLSEFQSEPLLNETGYRVAKEVRRRWRHHSTVHVDTGISRIRTKKARKLIANPSIKRGCVIKLPSVLKNYEAQRHIGVRRCSRSRWNTIPRWS